MMSRTKVDIKNRKTIVEGLLNNDNDLLTDSEKRSNDIKVKAQLRTIAEQVSSYKFYNKDIIKICSHDEVEGFHNGLSEVLHASKKFHACTRVQKNAKRNLVIQPTTLL